MYMPGGSTVSLLAHRSLQGERLVEGRAGEGSERGGEVSGRGSKGGR